MKQKKYDEEFKRECARLYGTTGKSTTTLAEELGVAKSTIWNWVNTYSGEMKSLNQVSKPVKPSKVDKIRIRELEKQARDQQEEIEILKKATAILCKDLKKSSPLS